MSIIKKLDTALANKIAAGEVIEKIANVVKELVENSLDAKATNVDVELIESGLSHITVTDNGSGMDETDALLAFERHATSKIASINDLFRINSLGFRGEALPSIAAVARVELITSKDHHGVKVVFEDGKFIEKVSSPANKGTKITVTRLFYTTPARFKYLKSPQYELAMIMSLIDSYALAFPHVSFRLVNNHKLLFVSSGNNSVIDIIANIYTKDVARQMFHFEGKNRDYNIEGYSSNPIINRSSNNYMNIFVNGRTISDSKMANTIRDCYDQLIPKNRYPVTVLYIECDPSIIDVNIHPRKQEIKFSEYQKLLDLIKDSLTPKLSGTPIYQTPEPRLEEQVKMTFFETEKPYHAEQLITKDLRETVTQKVDDPKRTIPDMEYIGQYLGTYLIFQNEEGLYLLDQHAAAERIRYERYLINMASKNVDSTDLLVPIKLDLTKEILMKLKEHLQDLDAFGIDGKIEGNSFILKRIPSWFFPGYEDLYAEETIMKLVDGFDLTSEIIIDDLAKLLACKHSLKANHFISKNEAERLLTNLRQCEKPYNCPHGRPIIVNMSINQIERWFNRVI